MDDSVRDRNAEAGEKSDGINQRRYPRVDLDVEVNMESEHNFYTGFMENISEGGLFVATHEILDLGREISLKFSLPSGRLITAAAKVVWHRDTDQYPGFGVRFLDLGEDDKQAINEFITRRSPIFYEK